MTRKKGTADTRRKFETPYRISGMCKDCTPEKPHPSKHNLCFNVNCICPHHPNWTALHAREKGLRTQAKPGDFDYLLTQPAPPGAWERQRDQGSLDSSQPTVRTAAPPQPGQPGQPELHPVPGGGEEVVSELIDETGERYCTWCSVQESVHVGPRFGHPFKDGRRGRKKKVFYSFSKVKE